MWATARVRNLRPQEPIPAEFQIGFDALGQLDYNWIWVVEDRGIEGILVAAPCHGLALLYRVQMRPGSKLLMRLLRSVMKDLRARGIRGFMTFLSQRREEEIKLGIIIERLGGRQMGEHMVMASPLAKEGV